MAGQGGSDSHQRRASQCWTPHPAPLHLWHPTPMHPCESCAPASLHPAPVHPAPLHPCTFPPVHPYTSAPLHPEPVNPAPVHLCMLHLWTPAEDLLLPQPFLEPVSVLLGLGCIWSSCLGHGYPLTSVMPSGLTLPRSLPCPPNPKVTLCPPHWLHWTPSPSRGSFFHHLDLAVDELREKQGCPIPSPLYPRELRGMGRL